MRKFDRNIGPCELTFIDRGHSGHNFHRFITYGKSRMGYLDMQRRKSKERPSERGNELRHRGRRRAAAGEGAGAGGGGGREWRGRTRIE